MLESAVFSNWIFFFGCDNSNKNINGYVNNIFVI